MVMVYMHWVSVQSYEPEGQCCEEYAQRHADQSDACKTREGDVFAVVVHDSSPQDCCQRTGVGEVGTDIDADEYRHH